MRIHHFPVLPSLLRYQAVFVTLLATALWKLCMMTQTKKDTLQEAFTPSNILPTRTHSLIHLYNLFYYINEVLWKFFGILWNSIKWNFVEFHFME